jgi:lactoylglutathione lyase
MPALLNFIVLIVRDVRASATFYRDALGATVKSEVADKNYIELSLGSISLALITTDTLRDVTPSIPLCHPNPTSNHSTFISFICDDLSTKLKQVITCRGTVQQEPRPVPWGGTLAFVQDPDGHLIELFQKG